MGQQDFQRKQLIAWLDRRGYTVIDLVLLAGDVSPRQYLRVELAGSRSVILACYPPSMRSTCRRFAATTSLLDAVGVRVPAVLDEDCNAGLMLLEDTGRATLYNQAAMGWRRLSIYYERAVELIGRIAELPPEQVAQLNPTLDEELLRKELQQAWELYLVPRSLTGDKSLSRRLRAALDRLCSHLGCEEPVPCHRDFMARNLVPEDPSGLVVLDHQDLRLGPPLYDVASLFNDSLFPPRWMENQLLSRMLDTPARRLSFHRAAAQRTLKAVGTFAAFLKAGYDRHEKLIAPTMRRALYHLDRLPETEALGTQLGSLWAPVIDATSD